METKYTNAIENDVATMLLYGEIGGPDLSAEYFTQEMRYHSSMGRKVKVYINSPGGSVFGGYSIIQAIMDYEADTHVVGLAASMAGIILQYGKKRTANDFALGMIHMPSQSGKKDNNVLKLVADSLINILSKRSNKSAEELEALMKEETWFDSSQMLEAGLIDEIVTTDVAAEQVYNYLETFSSAGELYNIYNKLLIDNEMKNIKNHFQLAEKATEDDILNSIGDLETKIESLNEDLGVAKTESASFQAEVDALRTENSELVEQIANFIVDNAIANGKIEKDKKSIWVEAAKKDAKSVQAQLDSITAAPVDGLTSVQSTVLNKKSAEDAPEKDIINWVRNNTAELIRLEEEDHDEFERLMNLYEAKSKE